jgi:hypothetical protein
MKKEPNMLIESLAWFAIGAGAMALALGVANLILRKRHDKFNNAIAELQYTAKALERVANAEVSELSFRSPDGTLCTVRIITDPSTKEGKSHDPLSSEFIFGLDAIKRMKEAGTTPDEIVTEILRTHGRM